MPITKKTKVAAVDGLFSWSNGEPYLIGSKCRTCHTCYFPKISTCVNPECSDKAGAEETALSRTGKLWSYTIQVRQPPQPFPQVPEEQFKPFGIGLVELQEGIRVTGMLTTTQNLQIGMKVELTLGTLYEDSEKEYLTWMFRPVGKGGR